jgi:SLT domain-containing protein
MAKLGAALLLAMFSFNASMTATIMRTLITSIGDIIGKVAEKGKELGGALGKGIANGLIDGVNKAIGAINYLLEKAVGVSKFLGPVGAVLAGSGADKLRIPEIPALAQGGIVQSATLALIGESGPEAVIPLDRMGSMGGGVNITIQTGVGDPVAIGREVKRVMDAYARRAA